MRILHNSLLLGLELRAHIATFLQNNEPDHPTNRLHYAIRGNIWWTSICLWRCSPDSHRCRSKPSCSSGSPENRSARNAQQQATKFTIRSLDLICCVKCFVESLEPRDYSRVDDFELHGVDDDSGCDFTRGRIGVLRTHRATHCQKYLRRAKNSWRRAGILQLFSAQLFQQRVREKQQTAT